jgi:hypothetical protein
MRRFVSVVLGCVLSAGFISAQTIALHDGQAVTLHGVLKPTPFGRLQFISVVTREAYSNDVRGSDDKPLHAVALAGYRDYALLYTHRGKAVTVTGTVSTDEVSPYYQDGMRFDATSILTADGVELMGSSAPLRIGAVGSYQAMAALPADLAAPWRYVVDGKPATRGMLSCSSNGGGDVVSCRCADGFHPVATASSMKVDDAKGQIYNDMKMAQFGVADDNGNENFAVRLTVRCSR